MKKTLLLFFTICLSVSLAAADFSLYGLTCEQMDSPVGIDTRTPRFSWKINAVRRGFVQAAYEIRVASSPGRLLQGEADLWNSGRIEGDMQLLIPYGGKPLSPLTTYWWQVRIANSEGTLSPWSPVQHFVTALFDEADWGKARWIAMQKDSTLTIPALHEPYALRNYAGRAVNRYLMPQLRKQFDAGKGELVQALVCVCGLGQFELFVNGTKAGNHFLDPGWSKYDKEVLYVTFDVTSLMKAGPNTLGVMLGNGFYNVPNERYFKLVGSFGAPKMRLLLHLRYSDGTCRTVVSDRSWSCCESPVTFSSIYGGEDYDATREQARWMENGFNDKGWNRAIEVSCTTPTATRPGNEMRVMSRFSVVSCKKNAQGTWCYDLGQNMSGIVRIKVKGERGARVVLRPAELINDDGTVNQSSGGAPYLLTYTLRGDTAGEVWQPQFTYYGFRYVQVEGAVPAGEKGESGLPRILSLEGLHTANGAAEAGSFTCSKPMFNDFYRIIDWGMHNNMASLLTDCPHREKLGWQEEAHLMQPSLLYRYHLPCLYGKIMSDLCQSQWPNGCIPTIAPEYVRFEGGFEDTPEWGSSFIICPWTIYKWYGDTTLVARYYPSMKRYLAYLDSRAVNHIVAYGLGDWYDIGPGFPGQSQLTSNGLTATAIYYYDTQLMARMARLLGRGDDAAAFEASAAAIKDAYNATFYHSEKGCYDRNSQTANAMSLYMGLAEEKNRPGVLASLVADIRGRGNALTAGDVGYRFVLQTLTAAGLSQVIYDMNSRYDVPGYGMNLAKGATALTESWQAYRDVSNDHMMLGHLMEWLFDGVGGIGQEEESVAYKHLTIHPQMVGDLHSARTSYDTPYGRVTCEWSRGEGRCTLRLTLPAGSDATVVLPASPQGAVTDYGVPVESQGDIRITDRSQGEVTLHVVSGSYLIECVTD